MSVYIVTIYIVIKLKNSKYSWKNLRISNIPLEHTPDPQLHVGGFLRNSPKNTLNTITSWWFQPILKNIRQIGNLPQVWMKIKKEYFKPPPRSGFTAHLFHLLTSHFTLLQSLRAWSLNIARSEYGSTSPTYR